MDTIETLLSAKFIAAVYCVDRESAVMFVRFVHFGFRPMGWSISAIQVTKRVNQSAFFENQSNECTANSRP
jgi:hypothetical protein